MEDGDTTVPEISDPGGNSTGTNIYEPVRHISAKSAIFPQKSDTPFM